MSKEKISIINNNIQVNLEQLKLFIINEWQSGDLYKYYYNQNTRGEFLYICVLGELGDFADVLRYEMEEEAQEKLRKPGMRLDWFSKYPKSDIRSIGFRVLRFLSSAGMVPIEGITTDDIPTILEFLDTPPDKSLEAWDKWEKYWANLDYPARRKKLLEEAGE